MLDFDGNGVLFEPWKNLIDDKLLERLVIERSPSGGFHVIYRSETEVIVQFCQGIQVKILVYWILSLKIKCKRSCEVLGAYNLDAMGVGIVMGLILLGWVEPAV